MKRVLICTVLAFLPASASAGDLFLTSDNCMACHNGMISPQGQDLSIGIDWRSTMMANASRDPYWQAGVRRETLDHPKASSAIEHECSLCHMPMAHVQAKALGQDESVFVNLGRAATGPRTLLAQDGVSCTVCHQIRPDNFGKPESFVGGFSIDTDSSHPRKAMGPFDVKGPVARVMASATLFTPEKASHLRASELCATCHTLITQALDGDGKPVGRLPEQVPYQEWLESSFRPSTTCADCHLPKVAGETPVANLLAEPRSGVGRHEFLGGNFMVPGILKALRAPMPALGQDLERDMEKTRTFLSEKAATLAIVDPAVVEGKLTATLVVENLAGHKLPTAYPSRRAWLHVVVKDQAGATLFESGALDSAGRIVGNDNDTDATRFEPHHAVIASSEEVQIYEAILGDLQGRVTTGLLQATSYLKDNRVLPRGFDKTKAAADVAVKGGALADGDFSGGADRVGLSVALPKDAIPATLQAELLYTPIGYRWAENLRVVDSVESRRFARGHDAMRARSTQRLAAAVATLPTP